MLTDASCFSPAEPTWFGEQTLWGEAAPGDRAADGNFLAAGHVSQKGVGEAVFTTETW